MDIGESITQVVPVYDGYSIAHATESIKLGGRDITEYLQLLIAQRGISMTTTAEFEIIKELKESLCFVSTTKDEDSKRLGLSLSTDYEVRTKQGLISRN